MFLNEHSLGFLIKDAYVICIYYAIYLAMKQIM